MSARDLLMTYEDAINQHDFNTLVPLISNDCKFWFSSGTNEGLEQARRAFEKTWALIKEEVYLISDKVWLAEGDRAAVCVYTFHWKGLIDGQVHEGTGRGTSCFRKEVDGWKLVHEHFIPFPAQS